MTYQELWQKMSTFTEEQFDCDITVEGGQYGCEPGECYPAELRICGPEHDCLDDNHPVIFIL